MRKSRGFLAGAAWGGVAAALALGIASQALFVPPEGRGLGAASATAAPLAMPAREGSMTITSPPPTLPDFEPGGAPASPARDAVPTGMSRPDSAATRAAPLGIPAISERPLLPAGRDSVTEPATPTAIGGLAAQAARSHSDDRPKAEAASPAAGLPPGPPEPPFAEDAPFRQPSMPADAAVTP